MMDHGPPPWTARTALVAALLALALWTMAITFYDPLGIRDEEADASSRETVAIVLCSIVDVNEQRLATLEDIPNLAEQEERARRSIEQLRKLSRDLLEYECGPAGTIIPARDLQED